MRANSVGGDRSKLSEGSLGEHPKARSVCALTQTEPGQTGPGRVRAEQSQVSGATFMIVRARRSTVSGAPRWSGRNEPLVIRSTISASICDRTTACDT